MGRKRSPGLRIRGGIWHIDKQILGRKVCESTGTGDLEEAELILARKIEEIVRDIPGVRDTNVGLLHQTMAMAGETSAGSVLRGVRPRPAWLSRRRAHSALNASTSCSFLEVIANANEILRRLASPAKTGYYKDP